MADPELLACLQHGAKLAAAGLQARAVALDGTSAAIDAVDAITTAADPDATIRGDTDCLGLRMQKAVGLAGAVPPDRKVFPARRQARDAGIEHRHPEPALAVAQHIHDPRGRQLARQGIAAAVAVLLAAGQVQQAAGGAKPVAIGGGGSHGHGRHA